MMGERDYSTTPLRPTIDDRPKQRSGIGQGPAYFWTAAMIDGKSDGPAARCRPGAGRPATTKRRRDVDAAGGEPERPPTAGGVAVSA